MKSSTASWVVPPQPSVTGRHKRSSLSESSGEVNTPPSECRRKNKVSFGLFGWIVPHLTVINCNEFRIKSFNLKHSVITTLF